MSTLTLDRSDPGIDNMVKDWKNGAEYDIGGLKVRQISSNAKEAKFEVLSVPTEDDETSEEESAPVEKPSLVVAYKK